MKKLFLSLAILLSIGLTIAHQPRLVYQQSATEQSPIQILNPEISQAFYGELKGQTDRYQIKADTGFLLYVQITIPFLTGANKDFVYTITNDQNQQWVLDGTKGPWEYFFEEFGGDEYENGPEIEQQVGPGIYTIKIENPSKSGKYVLVVGKKEEFPFNESFNAIKSMPSLKKDFFGKSPLSAYTNGIGVFVGGTILIFVGILIIFVGIVRKKRK